MISSIRSFLLVALVILSTVNVDSRRYKPNKASLTCTEPGRYHYPSKCYMYYDCDGDLLPTIGDCLVDLYPHSQWLPVYYNRTDKKCEYGGCPIDYQTTTTAVTTEATVSTTTPTVSSTSASSSTTPGSDFVCTENGYFPNKNSCTKFHVCVIQGENAVKYDFDCPAGTVYCPDIHVCGWERDCPCTNRMHLRPLM